MLHLLKDTPNSRSNLVQYCEKSGKAMSGSGGQE